MARPTRTPAPVTSAVGIAWALTLLGSGGATELAHPGSACLKARLHAPVSPSRRQARARTEAGTSHHALSDADPERSRHLLRDGPRPDADSAIHRALESR